MKFTTEKAPLRRALDVLSKAVNTRNTIPILGHALFELTGNSLTVTVTDLDLTASMTFDVQGAEDGKCTLPAHDMAAIVRNVSDGAQIEIKPVDHLYQISSGRSRFKLPTMDTKDWPVSADIPMPWVFPMDANHLGRIIDLTLPFVETNATRYYLMGTHINLTSDGMQAVSTDGHRMAIVTMTPPRGSDGMPGIIIPKETLTLVRSFEMTGDVEISVSESRIVFRNGGMTITSKLIDGTFPQYQRLIPTGYSVKIEADGKMMKATASRVALLGQKDAGARSSAVKVTLFNGACEFRASGANGEEAVDELELLSSSGNIEIGFGSRYLADICTACGDGPVTIAMTDENSPALITPSGEEGAMFILMPMRV